MLETGLFAMVFLTAAGLSWPLGRYLAWVFADRDPRLAAKPVPEGLAGQSPTGNGNGDGAGQEWAGWCRSMLVFALLSFLVCYGILTAQGWLPLNPDGRSGIEPGLAFNTAISFATNTNLQHYSGEASLSHGSQLFALMWLQFVSAATGLAAAAALARALRGQTKVGNFHRDVGRGTVWVLLPLAMVWAAGYLFAGVPMTLGGIVTADTVEGGTQTIARGPVAAFVAIKQLGTNGGGFFGANSAHPLENPNWWSNALSNVGILLLPMATVWMFGRMARVLRHATVLFGCMTVLFAGLAAAGFWCERSPAAALEDLPVTRLANPEGKDLRLGLVAGPLWAVSTTATGNGSVNSMHDSLNPLTGLVPLAAMWLNVVFGGVGVGLLNLFLYVVTAVFLAGMMVGRTPEYLGRKIGVREMRLAVIALGVHPLFILGGTALFCATPLGSGTPLNPGSHGLSEIAYEFSSAAANNGSGFEGLSDNTLAWNVATGIVMWLARFIPIILPLAIAGTLAGRPPVPRSAGTFSTEGWLFAVILCGTLLLVGALLFLPLAILGPVAEHLGAR